MPNWCNNSVEIYHKDPAMIERVRKAFNGEGLLQEFIPVPEELRNAVANGSTNEELIAKYGYSDWYGFCVNEWGTKWEVGADGNPAQDIPGGLMLSFDSAWAPPCAAYEKLCAMGFEIRAMYYEPGMCFAGIWEGNEEGFNDDYYEYNDMDSTEVANTLPPELDEAFCISESMAEWEEENLEIDLDEGMSAINEQEQENENK
jgi:hypothetical protein